MLNNRQLAFTFTLQAPGHRAPEITVESYRAHISASRRARVSSTSARMCSQHLLRWTAYPPNDAFAHQ